MDVNPASAEAQSEHDGQTFYFCSMECKERFDRNPQQYLDETDRAHSRVHRENPAA
jgi:Cu+-exporting ATPase